VTAASLGGTFAVDAVASAGHGRGAGTIIRRIAALLANLLCVAMLLVGVIMHSASGIISSPREASNAFIGVVLSPTVDQQIATAIVSDIAAHSTPAAATQLHAHRARAEAAVLATMHAPRTQTIVRADVALAYHIITSGSGGTINLTLLVDQFTSALYRAIPTIPAGSLLYATDFSVTFHPHRPINVASGLDVTGWMLVALGLTGAVLVARFLVRGTRRQLISVGGAIGLPALIAIGLGAGSQSLKRQIHYGDPSAETIIGHVLDHVASRIAMAGIVLALIDVAIVAIWAAIAALTHRGVRRTPRASSAT
jgi:hypothetical protein